MTDNRTLAEVLHMTTNRWLTLESGFNELLAKVPPVQQHRVESLREFANLQDHIEEAEFLLSVASELVALQTRVERAQESTCTGDCYDNSCPVHGIAARAKETV